MSLTVKRTPRHDGPGVQSQLLSRLCLPDSGGWGWGLGASDAPVSWTLVIAEAIKAESGADDGNQSDCAHANVFEHAGCMGSKCPAFSRPSGPYSTVPVKDLKTFTADAPS